MHPMAETTLHLTEQSFDAEIGKHKEVLMVDFWAEWCQPCRAIAPTLEELALESKGSVSLAKVNVDDNPQLAARYGVRSIPTILFMKDGKVMDQVIGAVPKSQLKKKLDALA
jgi:thioredoxin 1